MGELRVYDNGEVGPESDGRLGDAIRETLANATALDACVGYFNLRGWRELVDAVDALPQRAPAARVMIGMQGRPEELLRRHLRRGANPEEPDSSEAAALKQAAVAEFREQLQLGQSAQAEATLQRLADQIRTGVVQVKLHLRYPLHAKLYIAHRHDTVVPIYSFLGSSNLTFAGLVGQGELNVDVPDSDAASKLSRWFNRHWDDTLTLDIGKELLAAIEESWASHTLVSPYHVYLKIAYHLSREARAGLLQFEPPRELAGKLFPYQVKALQIAARHLHRRGGVLIGDVVGLGKTLTGTALIKLFDEDFNADALILCPKNLVGMWEDHMQRYRVRGYQVMSLSVAARDLPRLQKRFRLVLVDESHNLRSRDGRTYDAVRTYIRDNDARCILLSATPYNASYADLAGQLGLFLSRDADLGIRPERLVRDIGLAEFTAKTAGRPRSLRAFEDSPHPDDWRDLMRLFMVRRTRTFIKTHYTESDEDGRPYLQLGDGRRGYFPQRQPRTIRILARHDDPFEKLYSEEVVTTIADLRLPRYGLGTYQVDDAPSLLTASEQKTLDDLTTGGRRLVGFTKTGLFKRLESSGAVFLQSLQRHAVRNAAFITALEAGKPLPVGSATGDVRIELPGDEDPDDTGDISLSDGITAAATTWYDQMTARSSRNLRWLPAHVFKQSLLEDLRADNAALLNILAEAGVWQVQQDSKAAALVELLTARHHDEKVLIFTGFADTARYLGDVLTAAGVDHAVVSGSNGDPSDVVRRFSPQSNGANVAAGEEVRVLVSTDVLSEGQNLQDCAIVVNYDLPWAIIRLVQRAGRVDRIGQTASTVQVYSFMKVDGVEEIIRLRDRIRNRLDQAAHVIGSDEIFFPDDDMADQRAQLEGLYAESAVVLDDQDDTADVDLSSYAYQIWDEAVRRDPRLRTLIPSLPDVIFATKHGPPAGGLPPGVVTYAQESDSTDYLAWTDLNGDVVSESPITILEAARCTPETSAQARHERHHDLVNATADRMLSNRATGVGSLGSSGSVRRKLYDRLSALVVAGRTPTLFEATAEQLPMFQTRAAGDVCDALYNAPLTEVAHERLHRALKTGVSDTDLLELCQTLLDDGRLVTARVDEEAELKVICSLATIQPEPGF